MGINYRKPVYQQGFRRIFEFEKYGDNDNFFIELKYWQSADFFKSRLSARPTLKNEIGQNGTAIFKPYNAIKFDEYKLVGERVNTETNIAGVYEITEIYGKETASNYTQYTFDVVSFIGTKNIYAVKNATCNFVAPADPKPTIFNPQDSTFSITVEDASVFLVGQYIKLIGGPNDLGSYNAIGTTTQIRSISGNIITVENFSMSFVKWDGSISGTFTGGQLAYFISTHYSGSDPGRWLGVIYCQSESATRSPFSKLSNVINSVSYSFNQPDINSKFRVIDVYGGEVGTADHTTTPTALQYIEKIHSAELINTEDSQIELVEIDGITTTMWRKTQKKAIAK